MDGSELGLRPAKPPGKGEAPYRAVGDEGRGGGGRTKGWPIGEQGAKSLGGEGGGEEGADADERGRSLTVGKMSGMEWDDD